MLSCTFKFITILSTAAFAIATPYDALAPGTLAELIRRDADQVTVSCTQPGVSGCVCPLDLNGDDGVFINVFPGYQCAYKGGACAWSDKTGALHNTHQTNCPTVAPCPASGCVCPIDNNGDAGVLINQFKGYQCAYPSGACTWTSIGNLSNIHQTNCPTEAKCVAPASS